MLSSERARVLVRTGDVEAVRQFLRVSRKEGVAATGADSLITRGSLEALLVAALKAKQNAIVKLLLESGADVNQCIDQIPIPPLHDAACDGDERMVALFMKHGANVHAIDSTGRTALFFARSRPIAQRLMHAGADIHHKDENGFTALSYQIGAQKPYDKLDRDVLGLFLDCGANINSVNEHQFGDSLVHLAARYDAPVSTLKKLIALGATSNGRNSRGETPLHLAAANLDEEISEYADKVKFLLGLYAGGDIHADNQDGRQAFHVALRVIYRRHTRTKQAVLNCLREFCARGAKWDTKCNELLASGLSAISTRERRDRARALRCCVHHWMKEHTMKLELTLIPDEIVNRGADDTETYLSQLLLSNNVILRRKICIVWPSNWGKTSLIKSLQRQKPILVHPNDRTIGIDKYKLSFPDAASTSSSSVQHEVSFWDFAGHDEYQVSHALFFSRRTLYLVCIDLSAYTVAFYKAEIMTGGDSMAFAERMNAFVETRILRWIRLIFARQPDAEFQFVCTKLDALQQRVDKDAFSDLKKRLQDVMVIVREMERGQCQATSQRDEQHDRLTCARITHLGDHRLSLIESKTSASIRVVSCTQRGAVMSAQGKIVRLICKSQRSYPMPDSYMHALRYIKERRNRAASAANMTLRVRACFVEVDKLVDDLVLSLKTNDEMTKSAEVIDAALCLTVLRALQDLGDILWYEDLDDQFLSTHIILDPMLLVNLIREIFNHHQKSEVMFHADLKQLQFWENINEDPALMLAMKELLQQFHLAYPTEKDKVMQWDSDLMLPASWRSKTSAQLLFLGQPLNHPYGVAQPQDWQVDVHWELEIDSGFEEAVFDHLVVATYDPAFVTRQVGPDYLLYGDASGPYACRLVVDWHRITHKRVLHLEAVLAKSQNTMELERDATALWDRFEWICAGLAAVFTMFPGLRVSICARLDAEDAKSRS